MLLLSNIEAFFEQLKDNVKAKFAAQFEGDLKEHVMFVQMYEHYFKNDIVQFDKFNEVVMKTIYSQFDSIERYWVFNKSIDFLKCPRKYITKTISKKSTDFLTKFSYLRPEVPMKFELPQEAFSVPLLYRAINESFVT